MTDDSQVTVTAEAPRSGTEGLPPLPPPAPAVLNPWHFVWVAAVGAGLAFALGWRVGSDRQFDRGFDVGKKLGRTIGFEEGRNAGYRACRSEQDDDHGHCRRAQP